MIALLQMELQLLSEDVDSGFGSRHSMKWSNPGNVVTSISVGFGDCPVWSDRERGGHLRMEQKM